MGRQLTVEPMVYTPVSAAANLRRSTLVGVALGAVGIVLTSLAGHPFMGVFGVVGIALGALNNRLLQRSVILYATAVTSGLQGATKGKFRGGVFARLGGVTLVAIAIAVLDHPDGLGIFVGLAIFQLLMLVGSAVPLLRSMRPRPLS